MLSFREIKLEDRELIDSFLLMQPYRICDHCFPCLYIWEKTYPARFCVEDGVLYIKYHFTQEPVSYQIPYCEDERLPAAMENLFADAHTHGQRLRLVTLNEDLREKLEAVMPGRFEFTEKRDYADYI